MKPPRSVQKKSTRVTKQELLHTWKDFTKESGSQKWVEMWEMCGDREKEERRESIVRFFPYILPEACHFGLLLQKISDCTEFALILLSCLTLTECHGAIAVLWK